MASNISSQPMRSLPTIPLLTFLLSVAPAAIVSEDFDSITNGALTASPDWTAFSGADATAAVNNGSVNLGSGAEDVGINIGSNVTSVYFGVDVVVSDGASSDYVMGFRDGSSLAARFFLNDTGSGIQLGVNSGAGSSAGAFANTTFDLSTSVRLVGYADGTGNVSAWINPSASDLNSPDVTFFNSDSGGFENFYLRQGGSWDNGAASWNADNLVVTQSFAEAVPEPTLAALGGFALLLIFRRRR